MKLKLFYKIALSLTALSVSTSILVSVISHFKYKQIIKADAYYMLQSLVERHALELDNQTKSIEDYSNVLEAILRQTFEINKFNNDISIDEYERSLIPLLDTLAQKFKPLSYWIIFNPEYAKNGHTISFIDKDGDGTFFREPEYSINDFNLSEPMMQWWTDAIKYGEVWTDPYYWRNWDFNIISYSRRVIIDGKIIAVLGSDIGFDKFKQNIATRKIYDSGFLWILNKTYKPISPPKITDNCLIDIKEYITNQLKTSNSNGLKNGIIGYPENQNEGIIAYYRMNNGWYLCSFAPKNEIFSDLNYTMLINIMVILGGILLSLGLAILISRSLTKPVWQLVGVLGKGAKGDYGVRAKIKTSDELMELGNYFNFFMDELEKTMHNLKINELDLITAKERAEESEKLKSVFLANLSHEIRTPMNAIIGFTSLMLANDLDKETIQKYIDIVHLSTYNLLDILNNLIDYSLLESKVSKIENERFSIDELMEAIYADNFQKLKRIKKGHIKLQLLKENNSKEIFVYSDKLCIQQVFSNLFSNSIKFTEKGFISYGYKIEKHELSFFIEDSGIGIAQEDLEKIFESFYKGTNTYPPQLRGTGLGLTICKKLIKQMNGKISIQSKSGIGTIVQFTLPIQIVD